MNNTNTTTFRLTTDKKEGTWSLRGGSAKKNGIAKFINYWPGSNSIFDEDNKDSAVKPQTVVFGYNDVLSDPGVEIIVPNENKALIDYLKAHPFYGIHYKIHNQEEIDEEKSAAFDKIEEALSLIKETEDIKIQAIALAVFGIEGMGWTVSKCKAELKEKAVRTPEFIIDKMNSNSYEAKYLSGLAFFSGIVREDELKSAVVWDDEDKGIVLPLAKGESGITKLGELLATESDTSLLVLQEIGIRLNKQQSINNTKVNGAETVSGKTEAQIKEEAIAAYKASLTPVKTEAEIRAEIMAELAGKKSDTDTTEVNDLAAVQAKYKEVTGKDVPPRFANDIEWLKAKIAEKEI